MIQAPRAIALTGPTASGKTALSLPLAEALGGEIVSMDSRQVYRGMDIGTDKVDPASRARIPHHGLDIRLPSERYSAGRFARDARKWIEEIRTRGAVPILVGGTGFFLRALTEPLFREPRMDPARRAALRRHLGVLETEELSRWAVRLDPERAGLLKRGNRQRAMRTLEVALMTGRPLGWWHRNAPPEADPVPVLVFLMDLPRALLDRRIDQRVDRMIAEGFVEEVRSLLAEGIGVNAPGMTGTGYREIAAYLQGRCTLAEAADEIRRSTRGYARRQLTWFRNQLDPETTVVLDGRLPIGELTRRVVRVSRERGLGRTGPDAGPDPFRE